MARARTKLGMSQGLFDLIDGRGDVLAEAAAAGGQAGALFWHGKIMPLHFETFAPGRYPGAYAPLTVKYQRRKAHAGKPARPMVYSGRTLEILSGSASIESRKLKSRVNTVLRTPNAPLLNIWNKNSAHDFAAQISAQNATDFRAVARVTEEVARRVIESKLEGGAQETVGAHTE